MANDISLTGLTETLYQARDKVVREGTAFIGGSMVNGGSQAVSTGGTVTSIRTTQGTAITSYTPGMTPPDAADITTAAETLTLNKVAGYAIPLKGEQFLQLANTVGADEALRRLYAQGIRTMVNLIEAEAWSQAYKNSSRAVGTAGTTPFASNFEVINDLYQILFDNGCEMNDNQLTLAINSSAGTLLRNRFTKVNESGSDLTTRTGELLNISGFNIKQSAQIGLHTKGTGASYQVNQTGLTNGSRAITVDTGSGTILAGDIITFASGTGSGHNYVVGGALASNVVTLNHPGLRGNIADNNAITVGNDYTGNVAFHRSAVELVMRPPALPDGGDIAQDRMTMYDDKTGLVFEVALYGGYLMNVIDITMYYQCKVWKPEFVATLRG